jgi:hypothetical protein
MVTNQVIIRVKWFKAKLLLVFPWTSVNELVGVGWLWEWQDRTMSLIWTRSEMTGQKERVRATLVGMTGFLFVTGYETKPSFLLIEVFKKHFNPLYDIVYTPQILTEAPRMQRRKALC